ncbi:MAG: Glu-tRNA(Gln) amidotransferase subunit GatE [Candidatus ainarchaeum sp.]|nr:Glu-tRNA(Gln) amidotransferase subunit GatE [Candidatus ainarchaeum sp.]MDD3975815.1 Glu-tRNA(Gln) amidotransferase subunit GatE [Candidatus ainarchaeum sp.]
MKTITVQDIKDYKEYGLRCGLEIHQQLDTHKLFCKCKSKLIKEDRKPDKIIKRELRAVSSESGEMDLTAKAESSKKKTFIYQFYNECNCLVETDSQPPFPINKEALETSVIISNLTHSNLVDKSYVMRKQVVDGSNVSGFQRTTMISTDGYLDFDFGRVRIDKILLEEDAARAIERKENEVIYNLDRLGVPLIELVAWHDIYTPEDVKKVALYLGQMFRSTGLTKRGLGTIRQDINISITNGSRIELKGTQELDLIPEIVKREVIRQLNLLEVKKELENRNISKVFLEKKDISDLFKTCDSKIISQAFKNSKKVYAFSLKGFKGIIGFEVQPNRRVGTELAGILKKHTSLKGIFHSDELPNYGITEDYKKQVYNNLNLDENKDAYLLSVCDSKEIDLVKELLENRLNQLLKGIPKETRMVNIEGNSEYQRPLSTSSRMYPETDLLPITFSKEFLEKAKSKIPLSIKERLDLYVNKFKISTQLAEKMKLDNFAPLFENLVKSTKINPTTLCVFLLEDLVKASRDNKLDLDNLDKSKIIEFFKSEDIEKVPKQRLIDAFIYFENKDVSLKQVINDLGLDSSDIDLDKIVDDVFNDNLEFIKKQGLRASGLLMGRVMSKTKGLVDGKTVSEKISSKLKDFVK